MEVKISPSIIVAFMTGAVACFFSMILLALSYGSGKEEGFKQAQKLEKSKQSQEFYGEP